MTNSDEVHGDEFMDIADALQIVLDLARSATNTDDEALRNRRLTAIGVVEDMAVNQFGDD
jgi:hypothetical protein